MNYITTSEQVRQYLELNEPGSSSRYSDDTINSNILSSQEYLEHVCRRWFADRQDVTWATTTSGQAQVALPGFRTITTATWGSTLLSVAIPGVANDSPSAWALYEPHVGITNPLIVALQFRPWRTDGSAPWYLSDPLWWDKNLDSPFYPGNYGGGQVYTSMPNDLVVVGDGGYEPGAEPWLVRQIVKALAGWFTLRGPALLGNVAMTPGLSPVDVSSLPPEVRDFIADWSAGTQVVGIG